MRRPVYSGRFCTPIAPCRERSRTARSGLVSRDRYRVPIVGRRMDGCSALTVRSLPICLDSAALACASFNTIANPTTTLSVPTGLGQEMIFYALTTTLTRASIRPGLLALLSFAPPLRRFDFMGPLVYPGSQRRRMPAPRWQVMSYSETRPCPASAACKARLAASRRACASGLWL